MRLTKSQSSANRQLVLDTAAKLFRERGFDGIGLADLMHEAGFTHGGFYNHFASRAELCAIVARQVLEKTAQQLDVLAANRSRKRKEIFAAYVTDYLSLEARDTPGAHCLLPALGAEIGRQDASVKEAFEAGLNAYLASLVNLMPQQRDAKGKKHPATRKEALALLASLIGGMILARAVAQSNAPLSTEILKAAREDILS
jgi:TetR/AcrR family transcriptional repressor of nem operon